MKDLLDSPAIIFAVALVVLWFFAILGDSCRRNFVALQDDERSDVGDILTATFTLLGLIIGFSFSMAISRYDQRKNLEEAEANAIGTQYLRADLLPTEDAAAVRVLLMKYTEQRILFYTTRNRNRLAEIDTETDKVQSQLWEKVRTAALAQPTAVSALAVAGMNDVLNSRGFTQAAWLNRIPLGAWMLMGAIAIGCNLLLGYHARNSGARIFLISPLTIAIAFFLISDIDSPRGGVIRVLPQNLIAAAQSVTPR